MNIQSKISKLSIDQLIELRDAAIAQIETLKSENRAQVAVTKISKASGDVFRLTFGKNAYEAQKHGSRGRFRVYKLIKGTKPGTVKRGPLVKLEFDGGIQDLRTAIASGIVK